MNATSKGTEQASGQGGKRAIRVAAPTLHLPFVPSLWLLVITPILAPLNLAIWQKKSSENPFWISVAPDFFHEFWDFRKSSLSRGETA